MINLLSWRERQARRQKLMFFIRVSTPSLVVIMGFIVISFVEQQHRLRLENELKTLTAEVNKAEQIYADKALEMKEQVSWQERLARLQNHKYLRSLPLPLDVLPDKSSVQGIGLLVLQCQSQQCIIEGSVDALYQLRPFLDGLAIDPNVRDLKIEQLMPVASNPGEGSSLFTVSFLLGADPL